MNLQNGNRKTLWLILSIIYSLALTVGVLARDIVGSKDGKIVEVTTENSSRLARLEAGQSAMGERMARMEAGQDRIERKLDSHIDRGK